MSDPSLHRVQYAVDRRERKFPLPAGRWDSAVEWAGRFLPLERYDGAHHVVQVRTTYLDSPSLSSYREYVEDHPVRKKVRIRQYGYDGVFGDDCWIEIKIKDRGRTRKRRFRCATADLPAFLANGDLDARIAQRNGDSPIALQVYRAVRVLVAELELRPVVRVDFLRASFQSDDCSSTRLTLDREMRFHAAGSARSAAFCGALLELKYTGRRPPWARGLLAGMRLGASTRFSKFARAVETLGVDEAGR